MKKIVFLVSVILVLSGCTKEAQVGELIPEKSFRGDETLGNPEGEIIRSETLKVGKEEIRLVQIFQAEDRILEAVAIRSSTGEMIGKITYQAHEDFFELIGIESAPCICNPECWGYNEDLCNWWTCVDEFVAAHDSELLVLTVACPECGAGALAGIGLHCAQAGMLIVSN